MYAVERANNGGEAGIGLFLQVRHGDARGQFRIVGMLSRQIGSSLGSQIVQVQLFSHPFWVQK
jgi:hypothetical protein